MIQEIFFQNGHEKFSVKFFYDLKNYDIDDVIIEKAKLEMFKNSHYIQNNNMSLIINYLLAIVDDIIEDNDAIKANIFLKYSPIIRNEYLTF
jgi:hypothetical protein